MSWPYDDPAYVAAQAAHERATVEDAGGLALLRLPDGTRKTVYGYPQPTREPGEAADTLRGSGAALVLADHGPAAELTRALGAAPEDPRVLAALHLHPDEDPAARRHRRASRAIRTAGARGATTRTAPLDPETFGPFYRAAMRAMDAHPAYLFGDAYFEQLTAVGHFAVTVEDEHGPAACTLWLDAPGVSSYHLGGRRTDPEPVAGAMALALATGLAEAHRRGRPLALLGGGRTSAPRDPLLTFKQQLAPDELRRVTLRP